PMALFGLELHSAGGGQLIGARLSVTIGNAPSGFDPALGLEAIKSWIKRSLLDVKDVFRHLMDPVGNRQTVPRIMLKRFQDQHVERAINEIWFLFGHRQIRLDCLGETSLNRSEERRVGKECR